MMNGDKCPRSPCSKQLTLCAKLGLPHLVLTLACEDEAVPVKLALTEDMDVPLCAVADGLHMEVLATDCDCALLGHDGVVEVTHGVPFSWGLLR